MAPLMCEYCGCLLWNAQDTSSHPVPCRPGAAPGSTSVGVPPGRGAADLNAPLPAGVASLSADTAATGLITTGNPL